MKRKVTIIGLALAVVFIAYAVVAWNLLRGAGAYRISTWLGNAMSVSWQLSALLGLVLLLALGIPVYARHTKRKQASTEASIEQLPVQGKGKKRERKKNYGGDQGETPVTPTEKIAPAAATLPMEEEKITPAAATLPLEEEKIAPATATLPLEEEEIAPATITLPLEELSSEQTAVLAEVKASAYIPASALKEEKTTAFRCPHCNAELKKVVRFCAECGADLKGGSV